MKVKSAKTLSVIACAAAVLTAGCSTKTSTVPRDPEPTTAPVAPESIVFDWQSAYEAKLNEFKASPDFSEGLSGSMFDLMDLNADGTPELIISPDITPDSKCSIFMSVGGNITDVGTAGANGYFSYIPDKKLIGYTYAGQAFEVSEFSALEEGTIIVKDSFYNNRSSLSSGGVMKYQRNGEDIRIADYEKAVNEYNDMPSVSAGRKYSFDAESVNYALHCSESWSAVINSKQKQAAMVTLLDLAKTADSDTAFELFDIDRDGIPEIIVSEGAFDTALCRVFKFSDKNLPDEEDSDQLVTHTVLNETCSLESRKGTVYADMVNKAVYNPDADVLAAYSADGKTVEGFTASTSVAVCGRKYILTPEAIKKVLN